MGRCFWGRFRRARIPLLYQGLGLGFDKSDAVVPAPAVVIFVMTISFPAVSVFVAFVAFMMIFSLFVMLFSVRDFDLASAVSIT
jgi:hypothetical protein